MIIHEKMIALVARRFQILGEPCRLRILHTLQGGPRTVNQIVSELDGNQPNISKHLQILFDAGLVERERSGNSVLYCIADPAVFKLCELVCRSTAHQAARVHKYAVATRRNGIRAQMSHYKSKSTLQGAK
ncbi:MAG: metalloregulator ArsR/SmtB family transcription factor [Candidatus Sulfotelmatobacter sp.]